MKASTIVFVNDVLNRLSGYRFATGDEVTFQLAVERALKREGLAYEREVRLSPQDRIDFLLANGVGLELKINGATAEVVRQLIRYAQNDRIEALILCTTRASHQSVPLDLGGKPVFVHWQGGIG
jgi:hypothetical protein